MAKTNFRAVVTDLLQAGWTQQQIADACGVKQGFISDLYRGERQEPRYSVGKALADTHRRVMRRKVAA